MKNIKTTFESFLNEELSPKTYLSAADKLSEKGHKNRSGELRDYGRSIINNDISSIQPIRIKLGEGPGSIDVELRPEFFSFKIIKNEDSKEGKHGNIFIDWEIPSELLPEHEDFIGQSIYFDYDSDTNEIIDDPDIDGLLIDDRRTAVKLVNMLKQVINVMVNEYPELELVLPYLKVNDFYIPE